jgi:hypothetical protein
MSMSLEHGFPSSALFTLFSAAMGVCMDLIVLRTSFLATD